MRLKHYRILELIIVSIISALREIVIYIYLQIAEILCLWFFSNVLSLAQLRSAH